jgi:PAT family beta-lactamase induction signal transducer AmpG
MKLLDIFYKTIKLYTHPHLLAILALGFSSGLPFLLTLSTLSFWLTEAGVSKTTIGLLMFVSLPYSLKFLWAPVMDQHKLPYLTKYLGQRRSWAIASQIGLIFSLIFLGNSNPADSLYLTTIAAVLVSFFSATQDIVIDAYRIEILDKKYAGAGAAAESIGFRLGMLTSGAGALYLASFTSWKIAYWSMAAAVTIGIITVLLIKERPSQKAIHPPATIALKIMLPWQQLLEKQEFKYLITFIFFFKFGDTVLNAMSAPFLYDLGFTKIEFANVSKFFGISLMVMGGIVCGMIIHQLGVLQALIMCALLQVVSCLMFVIQSLAGHHLGILMITVGVESFGSGMVAAAFIAYLSSFCSTPYTASHFTILYSLGSLCRVLISALSGWVADHLNWTSLFLLTAFAVLPTLKMIMILNKKKLSENT